jgi:hypothetical protein
MEACAAPSAKLHADVQNLKYACRLQQLTPVHHLKCISMCVLLCNALPCDRPHSSSTACLTAASRWSFVAAAPPFGPHADAGSRMLPVFHAVVL